MTKNKKIKYVYIDNCTEVPPYNNTSRLGHNAYLGKIVVSRYDNNQIDPKFINCIKFFLARKSSDNKWEKYSDVFTCDYKLSEFLQKKNNPYPYKIKKFYYCRESFLRDHFEKILAG